jgi:hypothetical protein
MADTIITVQVADNQNITQGDFIELDSNGKAIKSTTVLSQNVIGFATSSATTGVGSSNVVGIQTAGLIVLNALVEDPFNTGKTYKSNIKVGDFISLGKKTGDTGFTHYAIRSDVGSCAVALESVTNTGLASVSGESVGIIVQLGLKLVHIPRTGTTVKVRAVLKPDTSGTLASFTSVEKVNDAAFSVNPTAGTVEWSLSTGNLKFNATDVTTYAGQPIVADYTYKSNEDVVAKIKVQVAVELAEVSQKVIISKGENLFYDSPTGLTGIRASTGTDELTFFDPIAGEHTLNSLLTGGGPWDRDGTLGYTYLDTLTDSVGIGTATPTEKLDVVGNATISGDAIANRFMPTGVSPKIGDSGSAFSDGFINTIYNSDRIFTNIIIGTINPTNPLTISPNAGQPLQLCLLASNLEYWGGSASPLITVDTSGNVGIGTTTPAYPLCIERDDTQRVIQLISSTAIPSSGCVGLDILINSNQTAPDWGVARGMQIETHYTGGVAGGVGASGGLFRAFDDGPSGISIGLIGESHTQAAVASQGIGGLFTSANNFSSTAGLTAAIVGICGGFGTSSTYRILAGLVLAGGATGDTIDFENGIAIGARMLNGITFGGALGTPSTMDTLMNLTGSTINLNGIDFTGATVTGRAIELAGTTIGGTSWSIDGSGNIDSTGYIRTATTFQIVDATTYIGIDGLTNMTFTDAISGTVTLADLISAGGPWTRNATDGVTYLDNTTDKVVIGSYVNPTEQLYVDGAITATGTIQGATLTDGAGATITGGVGTFTGLTAPSLTIDSATLILSTTTSGDIELTPFANVNITSGDLQLGGTARISAAGAGTFIGVTSPSVTIDSSTLTISTTTSGDIELTPFANVNITAGDLQIGGTARISAAGAGTFTGLTAPSLTIDSSTLILSTTTSGDIELTPFANVNITAGDLQLGGTARISAAGAGTFTGVTAPSLTIDSSTLTLSTTTSGDITLTPFANVNISSGNFQVGGTTMIDSSKRASGIKGVPTVRRVGITYSGGTQLIYTTGTNEIVTDVYVLVGTAFDGDTSIDIGDAGNNFGLLANANVAKGAGAFSGDDVGLRGAYLWDGVTPNPLQKYYNAATAINAYVATTTGTQGTATVYITTIDLS